MNYGFIRVAAFSPEVKPGNTQFNTDRIIEKIAIARDKCASLALFPELSVTGYTCGDLFLQNTLIASSNECLNRLVDESKDIDMLIIVGAPIEVQNRLYNCAVAICSGVILGIVPKTCLPSYNEYYEKRHFASANEASVKSVYLGEREVPFGNDLIFQSTDNPYFKLGIELCEDLWVNSPPSQGLAAAGALIIANPSASNETIGKREYRRLLVTGQSARCLCSYIYASAGMGESTTDTVYGGHLMLAENGVMLNECEPLTENSALIFADIDPQRLSSDRIRMNTFSSSVQANSYRIIPFKLNQKEFVLERYIDPMPFVPSDGGELERRCEYILNIQAHALAKRLKHIGSKTAIIGISGGLDSALALLVCDRAFEILGKDRNNIITVTMPGAGTTGRTYNNAVALCRALNTLLLEIPINKAFESHLEAIGHDIAMTDLTYENAQARIRTLILMNLATKHSGIVIGTGDLSELALGFATYNGDHMSMYGVNSGVPKTLVRYLVGYAAQLSNNKPLSEALNDILNTPVSPELLPPENGEISQKTEEIVGPYELHDFFLYYMLRYGFKPSKIAYMAQIAYKDKYDDEEILKWLKLFYKRFFSNQFKRSCMPDGPKIGSVSLSPRADFRMPSDAESQIWLMDL